MRRHEPGTRRDAAPGEVPREAEPRPAEALLALQRSAGNRAVAGMLARQPQPAPTAPKAGPEQKKGATMTVGLGDELVIPVDSMQWKKETELAVVFESTNPAVSDLHRAHLGGKHFETGFASTYALMSRLTDVIISGFTFSDTGPDQMVSMELEAKSVDHQPVR